VRLLRRGLGVMVQRVLLVASTGGHWVQLSRLVPAFVGMDVKFVTTGIGGPAPMGDRPVAVVRDASKTHPLRLIPMGLQMMGVLLSFRPNIVVTTGAAPGVVAIFLAKTFFGSKTIWIDSIANSEKVSLSARLVAKRANLRLTQWEDLSDPETGLKFFGAVI
jgi:hypothetical protein